MAARFLLVIAAATMAMAAGDTAVIVNSGSTNTAGFRIVVERSGKAEYTAMPRRGGRQPETPEVRNHAVPSAVVERLYNDLEAAKPLSRLPRRGCMKSASFGTTLTIEFDGQATPDLSCGDGGNSRMQALIQDSQDIVKLFE